MAWARWLLVALPVSWALAWLDAPRLAVFIAAGLAVVPLAAEMGAATEGLAARCGPAMGGLLNATCGNAAELIVAIVALRAGLVDLVKASLIGSILGNLLLILGLVLVASGLNRPIVTFNRAAAGTAGAMLLLAVVGLAVPALFAQAHPAAAPETALHLSEGVAVVLGITRSEEHTSELQSPCNLVCRLLLEKKKKKNHNSRRRLVLHVSSERADKYR